MNKKCILCEKRDFPILRKRRCIRCIANQNESSYKQQHPTKNPSLKSEYLLNEYLIKSRSLQDIASEKEITKQAVAYWLIYYEIPVRSNIEVLKKKIYSGYFSRLTADSAFLLGYIFTDGDLQYNNKTGKYFLRLYSKHKDNLEKVLKLLGSEAKIQHRKEVFTENIRQGEIHFIHIADEKIITDIINLGMVHNKNNLLCFPDIPPKMINHFIRGCWAGSGCVYYTKKGLISSRLVTGSLNFITRIEKELQKGGMKRRKIHSHKQTKSPSYYFSYAHNESWNLYRYLYKGANHSNTIRRHTDIFSNSFGVII